MAIISIIVPIYNIEKYLCQCMDSILAQRMTDIEVILVDDGSTDNCPEICDRYKDMDTRIQVIHKQNEGLVKARKTGLQAATGEYIAYVDGDDWIEPDMYECMYCTMIENDVDIVMCGRYEDTGEVSRAVYQGVSEGRYDKQGMLKNIYPRMIVNAAFFEWGLFPGVWDKLFRRECLEQFQMAVDDGIVMGEDAACTYPCLMNVNSIYVLHKCFYHYRQTTFSMVKKVQDQITERRQFSTLYRTVRNSLREYASIYDMEKQWEEYVLFLMLPRADGLLQGYEELDYLFPFPQVKKGNTIVLYGAGTYGQRLYRYLLKTGYCKVVAWVDRNYCELQGMGLKVDSPEVIPSIKYDNIVVANTYANSRRSLYDELKKKYPMEKICLIDEQLVFSKDIKEAFGLGE